MFLSATRRLLTSGGGAGAAHALMASIAARVPSAGLSGSQLQALLEDEFPSFSPSQVGALTLKEAVLQHPEVLRVEEGGHLQSKWVVRPVTGGGQPDRRGGASANLQKVRQYCSRRARRGHTDLVSLESIMARTGIEDVGLVDEVLRGTSHGLEVRAGVRIKPKRLPRSIVAFVDGDALPAIAVNEMCNALNVIKETSTVTIMRQRSSVALSSVDVVCPDVISTYLSIERRARELRMRRPDLREDVVYMCGAALFDTYATHVAPLNPFPDADVYVCCPSRVALVQPKRVLPFE